MSKMLISGAPSMGEIRVALIKDKILYDLDIEQAGLEQKKSNIYKGKISRVEPSLEAAFVDYGGSRHGFLPFKQVARSYLSTKMTGLSFSDLNISDVLTEGQEILVQIDKEERGTKGAALTTFISLAGSYLVLIPNDPRVGGISRRVDGRERDELRNLLSSLDVPEGMGLIVRTAGVGKSQDELKWDLQSLLNLWKNIENVSCTAPTPSLIYQEGDAMMRAVRDHLRQDIEDILVDNKELFEKTKQYIEQIKPDFIDRVKPYDGEGSMFSFYQIENQIETAYQRVVKLPSGGSISIDHTEALVSIDVNSSKATSGGDIEETAFNTNLEAADEIAKQLRLRDIGGLVVIDFIDMSRLKHQQEIRKRLRAALEYDRAKVQVGNITRFGLLEMSRQRLGSHLGSMVQVTCPRCDGRGSIRSVESLASSIVKLIEEEALKRNATEIQVQLPLDLATFILNEKRMAICELSNKLKTNITVLPNPHLETPNYKIKRISKEESNKNKNSSYEIVESPEPISVKPQECVSRPLEKPVISIKDGVPSRASLKSDLRLKFFQWIGSRFKKILNTIWQKRIDAKIKNKEFSITRYRSAWTARTRNTSDKRRHCNNSNFDNKTIRNRSRRLPSIGRRQNIQQDTTMGGTKNDTIAGNNV